MTRFDRIAAFIFVRLSAQAVSGTVYGFVQDASHAVVPDARVTARNVQTGFVRSGVTGADGGYSFAALPLGSTP